MFLFGMNLMGDGLKKAAGSKLEVFLGKLTDTPVKGILLGTGVTAVIQSSSATSVMTVGFVNSGMMKFRQAIGIILGAILGTSVTGWVVSLSAIEGAGAFAQILSTSTITCVIALTGLIMRMTSKKQNIINISDILMGFAVLMLGMSLMSGSVSGLKENEQFISFLTAFSNPFLGILAGAAITCVLQSASAAVGILQALTATGVIDFSVAFPLLMGIGIGAALPVLLSAIGANTAGNRTAFVYLLIDVLGAAVCGAIFYTVNAFAHFGFMSLTMTAFSVALANTLFRLVEVLLLAPFIGKIDRLTCLIIKDKKKGKENEDDIMFEDRFLPYPALAVSQCSEVMNRMVRDTFDCFISSKEIFSDFTEKGFRRVEDLEDKTDVFEDKISTYIMKITRSELNPQQNSEVAKIMHTISDFERIGDHALGLARMAKEMNDNSIEFSEIGEKDFIILEEATTEILTLTTTAFIENDTKMCISIEALNRALENLCDQVKVRHVERLRSGDCTLAFSPTFNNLLNDIERIAAHCSNIGLAVVGVNSDSLDVHDINKSEDDKISEQYENYLLQYKLS